VLREVTVKIRLERINIQKLITVEALSNNGVIGLVISSKFARRKRFKIKEDQEAYLYEKCE